MNESSSDWNADFEVFNARYSECLESSDKRLSAHFKTIARVIHSLSEEFNMPTMTILREMVEPSLEAEVDNEQDSRIKNNKI